MMINYQFPIIEKEEPVKSKVFKGKSAQRILKCCSIWCANSLVGVITIAKIPYISFAKSVIIGNANAAVLPVPFHKKKN